MTHTRPPALKDPNKLTTKQAELMSVVCAGNSDTTWCDLDQILERLSWKPSKESLQFSIRALMDRGLLVRAPRQTRRRQGRRVIEPTDMAKKMFGPAEAGSTRKAVEPLPLVPEGLDELISTLNLKEFL